MMQATLKIDRNAFLANRAQERMNAMQRAALQIVAGIDMDLLMKASKEEKQQASRRLGRLIERERLKGTNGHWSYDLNRHIALKQALDVLEGRTVRRRQMRHYC
ncbi:cytoplasmic protein [Brucella sp. 10RB9213]|uniref:cytoplasmic protein n=1 Tax=Brucella sp. 10RB9213 TaxID=1844039 RepID=UPI0012AE1EF3|nr:cytoplasmic protein [Brucella sp. 10RB9213]MRN67139.1 cytoplasmic protein [Brucella sp. 10RB9213]